MYGPFKGVLRLRLVDREYDPCHFHMFKSYSRTVVFLDVKDSILSICDPCRARLGKL